MPAPVPDGRADAVVGDLQTNAPSGAATRTPTALGPSVLVGVAQCLGQHHLAQALQLGRDLQPVLPFQLDRPLVVAGQAVELVAQSGVGTAAARLG